MSTTMLHRLQSTDGKTVIEFSWIGDRFQHSIEQQNGSLPTWRCESVEGTGDEVWADSPPLQQLSTETIEDQTMIMGVGGGGTSHYSVCVRLMEAKGCVDVHLDWAVRLSKKSDPPRLMNSYRGDDLQLIAENSTRIEATDQPGVHRVVAEASPGERTVRWSYRIRIPS